MKHGKIKDFLLRQGTDYLVICWKRDSPAASHMSGVWEMQIRTICSILASVLKTHGISLDDDAFRPVMTEIIAVVNS